jgi:CheY-like chemotaxis protein
MCVLSGKCVLAVDDELLVRFSLVDELEDAGAAVTEAIDGLAALTLVEAGLQIDALVTDVRMPRMDGWTLAERLRELHPLLPVLYVTGWSEAPRPVPGGRVIAKPFAPRVVPAALAELMNGADAHEA